MEKKGYRDSAWENQLRDLLAHNLDISLDELRLIAYNYRASDEKQIQIACQQPSLCFGSVAEIFGMLVGQEAGKARGGRARARAAVWPARY